MARRTWGSGSIYERKDGRWVAAVRVRGRRVVAYAHSPEEARALLPDLWRDNRPADSRMTVGRWLDTWLASMRPPRVRPSTWVSYELHVRHLGELAAIPLARLTPADVRLHMRTMTESGHAPRSVAYNLTILRMALTSIGHL